MHEVKPLPFPAEEAGQTISPKSVEAHHDKLYAGYVNKRNEIEEKFDTVDLASANQIYSRLRGLKEGETFAANGMILHELYFAVMGGDGQPEGEIVEQLEKDFGSVDEWRQLAAAVGMSARGWSVTAFDPSDMKLHVYQADAQNQGGVWGALPIIALDVYEHSYWMEFAADRKAYIEDWLNHLNWAAVEKRWQTIKSVLV